MSRPGVFWLASYPKSGNTWFRVFLQSLLKGADEPLDLNALNTGAIASAREWMDGALGFKSGLLSHDELDALRPGVYREYSRNLTQAAYHKVHDAYTYLPDSEPLLPVEGCLGALYFIRNPLDVAISFANHSCCSIDKAIEYMNDSSFAFAAKPLKQSHQIRQWLLSWSMHVTSWTEARAINLLVIRYEDMVNQSLATFTKAARFLELDVSEAQIQSALAKTAMDKLQSLEAKTGFREKPAKVAHFFRKGVVGDWKDTLTEEQINRIVQIHHEVMRTYGYLDSQSNPICS